MTGNSGPTTAGKEDRGIKGGSWRSGGLASPFPCGMAMGTSTDVEVSTQSGNLLAQPADMPLVRLEPLGYTLVIARRWGKTQGSQ